MVAKLSDDELEGILRAVPQRIVGKMFGGMQTVHLQRLASRWGFAVDGRKVDLFAVMSQLRSFLKQYGPALAALMEDAGSDDDSLGVQFLRQKVRKTRADADAAELRNAEREVRLRDSGLVSKCLELLCSRARATGELARRKWGDEGFAVFGEMVDGFGIDMREFVDAERSKRAAGISEPAATAKATTNKRKPRRRAVAKKSKTEP